MRKQNDELTHDTNLPQRKNIRLAGYDYSQGGYYFITLCVKNKKHYFGRISDGEMTLSSLGIRLNEEILLLQERENVKIPCYVIMPNHLHFIIWTEDGHALGNIIRRFKGRATRALGQSNMWQRNYFERIIRGEQDYWKIVEYIVNNPANWETDKEYSEYW